MAPAVSRPIESPVEQERVIAMLAAEMEASAFEVGEVFLGQLARLSKEARIRDFLAVLAIRNTRAILRSGGRRARSGMHNKGQNGSAVQHGRAASAEFGPVSRHKTIAPAG